MAVRVAWRFFSLVVFSLSFSSGENYQACSDNSHSSTDAARSPEVLPSRSRLQTRSVRYRWILFASLVKMPSVKTWRACVSSFSCCLHFLQNICWYFYKSWSWKNIHNQPSSSATKPARPSSSPTCWMRTTWGTSTCMRGWDSRLTN